MGHNLAYGVQSQKITLKKLKIAPGTNSTKTSNKCSEYSCIDTYLSTVVKYRLVHFGIVESLSQMYIAKDRPLKAFTKIGILIANRPILALIHHN